MGHLPQGIFIRQRSERRLDHELQCTRRQLRCNAWQRSPQALGPGCVISVGSAIGDEVPVVDLYPLIWCAGTQVLTQRTGSNLAAPGPASNPRTLLVGTKRYLAKPRSLETGSVVTPHYVKILAIDVQRRKIVAK